MKKALLFVYITILSLSLFFCGLLFHAEKIKKVSLFEIDSYYIQFKEIFDNEMNEKAKLIIETSKNKINNLNDSIKIRNEFKNTKNKIYKIFDDVIEKARTTFFEKYIKNQIEDSTLEKIKIKEFLGMYNGVLVVIFEHNYNSLIPDVLTTIIIENIEFQYPLNYCIFVFNEDELIDLKEAYDNQILKLEDIKNIHYLFRNKDKQKKIADFK